MEGRGKGVVRGEKETVSLGSEGEKGEVGRAC